MDVSIKSVTYTCSITSVSNGLGQVPGFNLNN